MVEDLIPGRTLPKLHFSVGGRRFRPCLEDIVEFLIALDAGLERFQANQLRAAMRRHPEVVAQFVKEYGESLRL
ncbi:hypothetical protein [Streptomyces sp. NPDC047197]|uniref:hypothetical protein n=1 Tax=unclassified Streptomyces TaxID=2593676 RepID=UPI0033DA52E6